MVNPVLQKVKSMSKITIFPNIWQKTKEGSGGVRWLTQFQSQICEERLHSFSKTWKHRLEL